MPRMGGLAIYIAFTEALDIFIGGTIIVITGALDDRYRLSP
jgi:UDP-GlcNAc:undecaprenyl-phosphate GlcNAc-1-phosphate transferase